jgi:hypothetical protein
MKPGSLSPLSRNVEALLAAERAIPPQPELVRRRAQLRARTALWQERNQERAAGGLSLYWRRMSLVAAVALLSTSGLAAWVALTPERAEGDATKVQVPVSRPGPTRAPVSKSQPVVLEEGQPSPVGQGEQTAVAAPKPGTQKHLPNDSASGSKSGARRTSPPEELTLLDRARRAVVAGNHRGALGIIDQHAKKFPKSELGEEREALRIRALEGAGLSKQAGRAASEFESRYPNSVLAPRTNEGGRSSP